MSAICCVRSRNMGKRIIIVTIGTLGDVLPYISLSLALKKHGYDVELCAPADFEQLANDYKIEFHNIGDSIRSFLTQPLFENVMSQNMLINLPALLVQGQDIVEIAAHRTWKIAFGADAIILNLNTSFCIDIAEALNIPAIMTALQPLNDTKEFPFCTFSGPDLGPVFNRLSYTAASVQQAYYDLPRNRLRKELMGLKPRKKGGLFKDSNGKNLPTLYAYSEHVSPRPRDWPKEAKVTGFWRVNDISGWEPSMEFKEFLQAGEKPVYIGFGSMPFGAKRNGKILTEAVAKWGGRAVISKGWGGIKIDNLPPNIFAIEKAPHDKLFKYMAASIHHGGAGTTSASLHAGLPSFILPQTYDQPFWGHRVHELGCGPAPVSLRKLNAKILTKALFDIQNNEKYRKNAQELSKKLNQENGAQKATKHIERIIENFKPNI